MTWPSIKYSFIFLLLFVIGCRKDSPLPEPNDEEVITRANLTFQPVGGGSSFTVAFDDADGPGGADPIIQPIVLAQGMTYNVVVEFLNTATSPITDITAEVQEEAEAHRTYYLPSTGNLSVATLDTDSSGVPLGIITEWTTGGPGIGKVRIVLRHYPGTPPGKLEVDEVSSSKSSTDLDIEFDTVIQ